MKKTLLLVALCLMSSASFAAVLNCSDSTSGKDAGRVEISGTTVYYSNSRTSDEAWELRIVGKDLLNADAFVQNGRDIKVGTISPTSNGVVMSINGRTLICQ